MNTRGQAWKSKPNEDEYLGIELGRKQDYARFKQLHARTLKSTEWACPTVINYLGIGNNFNTLITNVGLQEFVYQGTPTYHRLTLELLTTLKHTVLALFGSMNEGLDIVTFQLMNRKYDITLGE
jgi:hypothetical protein